MSAGGDFEVTITKSGIISSPLPMQEYWLPQSNLDLLVPPLDVSVYFCYTNVVINEHVVSFGSMVDVLQKALAETLVTYYVFAGEVVHNSVGEAELLCNNRGVDFVQVYADVSLENLNLYNPDETIEGKLIQARKQGTLSVQVTELKCGAIVVACTFDHRVADAYSINMFLVSWAEMAQSKPLSVQPSFRRSLLNPRRPVRYHPSLDHMYIPVTSLPPPTSNDHHDQLISRIYSISVHQMALLQALASTSSCKQRTKLESFSAFLWQMVAKASIDDDENDSKKVCKIGIIVDGRSRLDKKLMNSYFGNVFSIPFGEKLVDELSKESLSCVANSVHDFIESAVTTDHFLDLIDWLESQRPVQALPKVYCCGTEEGPALVVSSGQRFPISKVDFGWGKPFFGSYHFHWGGTSGYVMPMPSPAENGDWVVFMYLLEKQIEQIENEASHIFKPLSFDYLKFINSPSK